MHANRRRPPHNGREHTHAHASHSDREESDDSDEEIPPSLEFINTTRTDEAPLDAILSPNFNMRQIVKEMILLTDHLTIEQHLCRDCIYKHLLTIEGYLEEAQTLICIERPLRVPIDFPVLIGEVRSWLTDFEQIRTMDGNRCTKNQLYCQLAQKVRAVRKQLQEHFTMPE
jgi:hypothetical protein